MMIDEAIFDVETKKLFSEVEVSNPSLLGVSIVSVYLRTVDEQQNEIRGVMKSFWERELALLWPLLSGVRRIIGFNSLKFDVPVLQPYSPTAFVRLPHFDIMSSVREALGHNLSLLTLVRESLGESKVDSGVNAVAYWKSQDPADLFKLQSYCESDVLLTRDLYDYGVRNKHLKYVDKWNNHKSFPVDFSYPKAVIDASRQMGMF